MQLLLWTLWGFYRRCANEANNQNANQQQGMESDDMYLTMSENKPHVFCPTYLIFPQLQVLLFFPLTQVPIIYDSSMQQSPTFPMEMLQSSLVLSRVRLNWPVIL